MKICSLIKLAAREGVTHEYLRHLMQKVKRGDVTEWRGWQFFGIEGKCWMAYKDAPEDFEIDV